LWLHYKYIDAEFVIFVFKINKMSVALKNPDIAGIRQELYDILIMLMRPF